MNYLKVTLLRKLKFKLKLKLKQFYKVLEEWGKAASYAIHR